MTVQSLTVMTIIVYAPQFVCFQISMVFEGLVRRNVSIITSIMSIIITGQDTKRGMIREITN